MEQRLKFTSEKLAKGLFKQSSYEQGLDEKIQAMRIHAQRFDESAKLCSYEMISQTHLALTSHRKDWRETQNDIVNHLKRSRFESHRETHQLSNDLLSKAGNIQKSMDTMTDRIGMLEGTLARFLASNERIEYQTEGCQMTSSFTSSVTDFKRERANNSNT